jgi:undecaprenyl-diphosphatase
MSFFEIFILSLIEGLTEYLPISSTGHLIIASHVLDIQGEFVTHFNIIIQFGAILAVLALYWKKFLPINWQFYQKIFVGFLPSAVIGLLVKDHIDKLLTSISVVAWALLIGGIVLIALDRKTHRDQDAHTQKLSIQNLSLRTALFIGFFQCLAFIPGVSRSAATILGGILLGMDKRHATEFSFFLAVPTLAGATLLKVLKVYPTIQHDQILSLTLGLALSFAFAILAIRGFVALVSRGVFQWFGWYRILLGVSLLLFVN